MHDLLRYARFHLSDGTTDDGTQLLKPESVSQMQSIQVTIRGHEAIGLGWMIDEIDGTRQLWHDGGTRGQISSLTLTPEHNFAIAILTNANRGGFVTRDVTRWASKQYLGLEIPDPTPIQSSEEELAPHVGHYVRPFADIELGILGGKLVAQITYKGDFPYQDSPPPALPPMSLALSEKDRLFVLDGPFKDANAEIVRKPDGSIGWLRIGGRIHAREG